MTGLSRPEWLFPHKKGEHVWISPPGSAGAWAERGRGRWLEHDWSEPARVALPSQRIEHVWLSPPGSAGAWVERGRGRWLEHGESEPARVASL